MSALLLSACQAGQGLITQLPPLPTADVPPLSEVDAAIERWRVSQTLRYFAEVEERTTSRMIKVRLVVVDGQVRTAQQLVRNDQGDWDPPTALSPQEAQAYTIDALLERIRRDTLGTGPAPVNLRVVFDPGLGFPSIVHAEALPTYTADGKERLNRQYSYQLVVTVTALLEDTFGIGRQPILTLTRSGGSEAWCDNLRIFPDGSSVYTDECSQTLLQLRLPQKKLQSLLDLAERFASLDDLRSGNGTQRLLITGSGTGSADEDTLQSAWELAGELHHLLSKPIGAGLTLLYLQDNKLYGYNLLSGLAQPAKLPVYGAITGAAVSPDRASLVYGDDQGLRMLDLTSGDLTLLLPAEKKVTYRPLGWSQSNILLAVQTSSQEQALPQWGLVMPDDDQFIPLPSPLDSLPLECVSGWAWSPQDPSLVISIASDAESCQGGQLNGLYLVDAEANTVTNLLAIPLSSEEEADVTTIAGVHTPAWSPDGEWLALGLDTLSESSSGATTQLALIRPDGSELTYLTDYPAGQVAHPIWGAKGELFYTLTGLDENADGIYRLSADRETPKKLLSGSALQTLSLSPDGEFLAYQSSSGLNVWSFALGQTIGVTPATVASPAAFIDWLSAQE